MAEPYYVAMREILLSDNDGNGFRPPCAAQLDKYKACFVPLESMPHPLAVYNHSWAAVVSAFDDCFEALEAAQNAPNNKARGDAQNALAHTTREIYYRMTEFFENIDDSVSKSLSRDIKRPLKFTGPSSLRKRVSIPCNKLKHNHNRLHYVEATALGVSVPGFSIYHVTKGALQPNPEIHKRRRAFSFNVELRRIFVAAYFYMFDVGEKIARHCALETEDLAVGPADPGTIAIIAKLQALPAFAMPFETSHQMPSIMFDGKSLSMTDESGVIFPAPLNCRMIATFIGDGFTKSFGVP